MITRPFNIYDHPKLLKLKVCYTLDNPYTTKEREQLAELIYEKLYLMRTPTPVEIEEWEKLLDLVVQSRLTVGKWLEQFDAPAKGVANG